MDIDTILNLTDENTKNKLLPILDYINTNYNVTYDKAFSTKTLIPTFRLNKSYVAIGCRKHYISIYFSSRESVNIITSKYLYCRGQTACVNFSYKRDLPFLLICKAIDCCFTTK